MTNSMRRCLFCAAWFLLAGLSTLAWTASPETVSSKVVCFGDSITRRGYPETLNRLLGVEPVNAGVGGNTTAQALRRMATDVLAQKPDVVVIFFGTNDCRIDSTKYVPVEKYAANLEKMIDTFKQQKAAIVLCTVPPINHDAYFTRHKRTAFDAVGGLDKLLADYRQAAIQVAKSRSIPVVDLNQMLVSEPEWLSSDGVHPSPAGNAIIAKHVANAVRPLLKRDASTTISTKKIVE